MEQDFGRHDEIVQLPVPRPFFETMVYSLADAMRGSQPSSAVSTTAFPPIRNEWTKSEMKRLKNGVSLSKTAQVLLDVTAERAGEWVDFAEIYEKAERTPRQAQGELAGFTQLLKRQFGKAGQHEWPVEVKLKNSPEEQTRYLMAPVVAQWWLNEKSNTTVEDIESDLIFCLEESTSDALNCETGAKVVNFFIDQVLDALASQGGDYLEVIAEIRQHADELYKNMARDH